MKYIDENILREIENSDFLNTKPYPWVNPEGILTQWGYRQLVEKLPDMSLFDECFDIPRNHGQKPHDRYQLIYEKGLDIPTPWKEFITELHSEKYRQFISNLFQVKKFHLRLHWQFAVAGCSVSPHCDGDRKIGSQIFYLNTPDTWDESWGGQTIVLDDDGEFDCSSSPSFDAFKKTTVAKSVDNYSFIFAKTNHSWHGMKELTSPEGKMRKVFIVTINKNISLAEKVKIRLKKYTKLKD